MSPGEAIGIALILVACAAPVIVIGVVYYLKKRFEHKQIMAAIEKGTPLSELRPISPGPVGPMWIKHLSGGVLILAIGLAFLAAHPWMGSGTTFVGIILCGVGIASMVRGLLSRKYQPQSQPLAKNNAAKNKSTLGVSASETSQ